MRMRERVDVYGLCVGERRCIIVRTVLQKERALGC